MTRIGDLKPGEYAFSKETLDGDIRFTFYRREEGQHDNPRFVRTTLLGFAQFRDEDVRALEFDDGTPVFTDRLYPVHRTSEDGFMQQKKLILERAAL